MCMWASKCGVFEAIQEKSINRVGLKEVEQYAREGVSNSLDDRQIFSLHRRIPGSQGYHRSDLRWRIDLFIYGGLLGVEVIVFFFFLLLLLYRRV